MVRLSLAGSWSSLAMALMLSACGLTAPRSSEGYADLESLGMRDTDTVMTLSIGPALLRFAASHVDDEPEVRDLLKSLDGIRIRIYEINGDASTGRDPDQHDERESAARRLGAGHADQGRK